MQARDQSAQNNRGEHLRITSPAQAQAPYPISGQRSCPCCNRRPLDFFAAGSSFLDLLLNPRIGLAEAVL